MGRGVEVRYASIEDEREDMIWVEVTRPDASKARYVNRRLDEEANTDNIRRMDCVDCHNRATHIYETPVRAVETRMRLGEIDGSIPFIRKAALSAIAPDFPSAEAARRGIAASMATFYRRHAPAVLSSQAGAISEAVDVLQEAWERNNHPYMKLEWDTYRSLLGHREARGCFRCHNRDMVDENGSWIPDECTVCHSMLAVDAAEPFANLDTPGEKDPRRLEKIYLRQEFMHSYYQ